ncbi:hypothetical protein LH425_09160 [Laribacter hongkongensis]|uniref:hypothetical protein n=1 Tax=Laribacter hongkongensis TaxID=168471 RepID=UPI001EFE35E7|nr:hypothetical protein [Laribacter hongkongensis]MCG9065206.1 hypothetical protein [Laribacter hongkongensis]
MATVKLLQRSFAGGEVTPEFFGRIDDAKYQSGLAVCRNFVLAPHGPAMNRAGFAFVREVKDSNLKVRLIPFTYSTTQTMVIELGAGYFRFHTQGATLMQPDAPDSPYEVSNPYREDELFDLHYVQSADVMTLVHPNHPPQELRRLGATNWELKPVSLQPVIAPPENAAASTAGCSEAKYDYEYVVTAVMVDLVNESAASNVATVRSNVYETGCTNTISWSASAGAYRYNVYKKEGGVYGYIGQTAGLSLVDDNISPDLSKTPPIYDNVFSVAGQIESVPVTAGGSFYGTHTGIIQSVTVLNGVLFKYISFEGAIAAGKITIELSVSDPTGSGARLSATVGSVACDGYSVTAIKTVTVIDGGKGYTSPSIVTVVKQDGRPITGWGPIHATYSVSTSPNTVQLAVTDSGGGSGAALEPVIIDGAITAVNVINGGSGYFAPVVSVSYAGGGSGATFGQPVVKSSGDYPGAVSYFEQRRCFAGTTRKPQNIWMTKSGTESNMGYSLPVRDDDRIAFRVSAREANTIRHIVPLAQLLLLTSSAEWRVTSVNSDAITPRSISVRPQSYIGASNVQPVIINNTLIYASARGGHVRELAYNWQAGGFVTGDLSIRAPHLFDDFEIVDMAFGKSPQPVVWFVSSSGCLIGLTYVPEQQVGAWHWHDTDGVFESCAAVAEGAEDVLYCVIRRTVNGCSRRYVERMASRKFTHQADAFFVDCGATYTGESADRISGLHHLEGKTVSILADGAVHPQRVVTDGTITLDVEASKVQIGLPITADLQTLPIAAQVDGAFGQGRFKNVNKVWLRVYRSSGIWAGPDVNRLTEAKQRKNESAGTPPALKSEEIPLNITPSWADSGQVYVRQVDPLPLTVVSMTAEIVMGG